MLVVPDMNDILSLQEVSRTRQAMAGTIVARRNLEGTFSMKAKFRFLLSLRFNPEGLWFLI